MPRPFLPRVAAPVALGVLLLAGPAAAQDAPAASYDAARIAPHTTRATAALSVMGQTIEMTSTRTVRREADGWRVVDVTQLPSAAGGGTVADTSFLDAAAFHTRWRRLRAETPMGAQTLRADFTDSTVTGTMTGPAGPLPLAATHDGPVLGGALDLAVAAMPLADGYAATVRVFDPQFGAGVRPFRVAVAERETVAVPAGTFTTFRVDVTPLDGNATGTLTLWIDEASPHVTVKSEARLPDAMGGGLITTALTGRD